MNEKQKKIIGNLLEKVIFNDNRIKSMKELIRSFTAEEIDELTFKDKFFSDQIELSEILVKPVIYFIEQFIIPRINNFDDSAIRKMYEQEIKEKDDFMMATGKRLAQIYNTLIE
jgi:hypothetical protein